MDPIDLAIEEAIRREETEAEKGKSSSNQNNNCKKAMDTTDKEQLLQLLRASFQLPGFDKEWRPCTVKVIKNSKLEERYCTRRAEIKEKLRSGTDPMASILFISGQEDDVVEHKGVSLQPEKPTQRSVLGPADSGVHMHRRADLCLLDAKRSCDSKRLHKIVICKVVLGRSFPVDMNKKETLKLGENFHSRVNTCLSSTEDDVSQAIEKSMVYIYELDKTGSPVRFPRQILPLGIVTVIQTPQPRLQHRAPGINAPENVISNIRESTSTPITLGQKNESAGRPKNQASSNDLDNGGDADAEGQHPVGVHRDPRLNSGRCVPEAASTTIMKDAQGDSVLDLLDSGPMRDPRLSSVKGALSDISRTASSIGGKSTRKRRQSRFDVETESQSMAMGQMQTVPYRGGLYGNAGASGRSQLAEHLSQLSDADKAAIVGLGAIILQQNSGSPTGYGLPRAYTSNQPSIQDFGIQRYGHVQCDTFTGGNRSDLATTGYDQYSGYMNDNNLVRDDRYIRQKPLTCYGPGKIENGTSFQGSSYAQVSAAHFRQRGYPNTEDAARSESTNYREENDVVDVSSGDARFTDPRLPTCDSNAEVSVQKEAPKYTTLVASASPWKTGSTPAERPVGSLFTSQTEDDEVTGGDNDNQNTGNSVPNAEASHCHGNGGGVTPPWPDSEPETEMVEDVPEGGTDRTNELSGPDQAHNLQGNNASELTGGMMFPSDSAPCGPDVLQSPLDERMANISRNDNQDYRKGHTCRYDTCRVGCTKMNPYKPDPTLQEVQHPGHTRHSVTPSISGRLIDISHSSADNEYNSRYLPGRKRKRPLHKIKPRSKWHRSRSPVAPSPSHTSESADCGSKVDQSFVFQLTQKLEAELRKRKRQDDKHTNDFSERDNIMHEDMDTSLSGSPGLVNTHISTAPSSADGRSNRGEITRSSRGMRRGEQCKKRRNTSCSSSDCGEKSWIEAVCGEQGKHADEREIPDTYSAPNKERADRKGSDKSPSLLEKRKKMLAENRKVSVPLLSPLAKRVKTQDSVSLVSPWISPAFKRRKPVSLQDRASVSLWLPRAPSGKGPQNIPPSEIVKGGIARNIEMLERPESLVETVKDHGLALDTDSNHGEVSIKPYNDDTKPMNSTDSLESLPAITQEKSSPSTSIRPAPQDKSFYGDSTEDRQPVIADSFSQDASPYNITQDVNNSTDNSNEQDNVIDQCVDVQNDGALNLHHDVDYPPSDVHGDVSSEGRKTSIGDEQVSVNTMDNAEVQAPAMSQTIKLEIVEPTENQNERNKDNLIMNNNAVDQVIKVEPTNDEIDTVGLQEDSSVQVPSSPFNVQPIKSEVTEPSGGQIEQSLHSKVVHDATNATEDVIYISDDDAPMPNNDLSNQPADVNGGHDEHGDGERSSNDQTDNPEVQMSRVPMTSCTRTIKIEMIRSTENGNDRHIVTSNTDSGSTIKCEPTNDNLDSLGTVEDSRCQDLGSLSVTQPIRSAEGHIEQSLDTEIAHGNANAAEDVIYISDAYLDEDFELDEEQSGKVCKNGINTTVVKKEQEPTLTCPTLNNAGSTVNTQHVDTDAVLSDKVEQKTNNECQIDLTRRESNIKPEPTDENDDVDDIAIEDTAPTHSMVSGNAQTAKIIVIEPEVGHHEENDINTAEHDRNCRLENTSGKNDITIGSSDYCQRESLASKKHEPTDNVDLESDSGNGEYEVHDPPMPSVHVCYTQTEGPDNRHHEEDHIQDVMVGGPNQKERVHIKCEQSTDIAVIHLNEQKQPDVKDSVISREAQNMNIADAEPIIKCEPTDTELAPHHDDCDVNKRPSMLHASQPPLSPAEDAQGEDQPIGNRVDGGRDGLITDNPHIAPGVDCEPSEDTEPTLEMIDAKLYEIYKEYKLRIERLEDLCCLENRNGCNPEQLRLQKEHIELDVALFYVYTEFYIYLYESKAGAMTGMPLSKWQREQLAVIMNEVEELSCPPGHQTPVPPAVLQERVQALSRRRQDVLAVHILPTLPSDSPGNQVSYLELILLTDRGLGDTGLDNDVKEFLEKKISYLQNDSEA